DQWYLHRQQDAAGAFFWKVAQQGHNRDLPEDRTRQGIYVATPEGELLGSLNSWSPEKTLAVLRSAADAWAQRVSQRSVNRPIGHQRKPPSEATSRGAGRSEDPHFARRPPDGGLILNVFSRIPQEAPGGPWTPNRATGRDHLWLTRDEWRS